VTSESLRMPAVFFGHGNLMNALLENEYTAMWAAIGRSLPRPKATRLFSKARHETARPAQQLLRDCQPKVWEEFMNVRMLEPMLRNATIKAIDGISKKASEAEDAAETAVNRLLRRWNQMDQDEKEQVVGIVIATATTAVGAIAALKAARKSKSRPVKVTVKSMKNITKKKD